jgi:hypothetical protein
MRRYLSRTEFAERIGVTPGALSRYRLPEADVMIGAVRGWAPETIDRWQANRPGRGARTDLAPTLAPEYGVGPVSLYPGAKYDD